MNSLNLKRRCLDIALYDVCIVATILSNIPFAIPFFAGILKSVFGKKYDQAFFSLHFLDWAVNFRFYYPTLQGMILVFASIPSNLDLPLQIILFVLVCISFYPIEKFASLLIGRRIKDRLSQKLPEL